jgi:hypothetical protein
MDMNMPDALTRSGACIDNSSVASSDDAELIRKL